MKWLPLLHHLDMFGLSLFVRKTNRFRQINCTYVIARCIIFLPIYFRASTGTDLGFFSPTSPTARGIRKRTPKKRGHRPSSRNCIINFTQTTNFAVSLHIRAHQHAKETLSTVIPTWTLAWLFWWDTLGGYWAQPTQSYLVLRCQKPAVHTSSSREEAIWLEEGDHMGYFMGKEMLNSPTIPVISNPLPPAPLPRRLRPSPNLTATLIKIQIWNWRLKIIVLNLIR